MKILEVIQNAIPEADKELANHILWSRTPFPMGKIDARSIYKAAASYKRAADNGLTLCDWCENIVQEGQSCCHACETALGGPRDA